jgi:hypothetical protein
MQKLIILALLFVLIVAQENPCWQVVQSGDNCNTVQNCDEGNVFWSYPMNKCKFSVNGKYASPKNLNIWVNSLYTRNYTMTVTDLSNV